MHESERLVEEGVPGNDDENEDEVHMRVTDAEKRHAREEEHDLICMLI